MWDSRRTARVVFVASLPFACDAQRAAPPPEVAPTPSVVAIASVAPSADDTASAPIASATASSAPIASAAPTDDCGENEQCARGNMWGDPIGDSFGPGLVGPIDAGPPRDAGGSPTLRIRFGTVTVSGRLPPEVIERIVRQNFGRFRLCYQDALRKKPKLAGDAVIRFVIGRDGNVSSVSDHASTIPDPKMVACITRSFGGLSFPEPEGGIVTVTFTIKFAVD